jgi:Uma2 family endonuclease
MPQLKRAELIGGIVYMPSPTGIDHSGMHSYVGGWLTTYCAHTTGTDVADNATTIMAEDSPQPDQSLRLLPEAGGRTRIEEGLLHGAPELVVEVCASSASYDLHVKKDLYEEQHVDEYVAVLVFEREIRWHRWEDGAYRIVPPDKDGIWRSTAFPGLWLDGPALLKRDLAKVLEVVQQGLESPEHAEFVKQLEQRMGSGKA